MVKLKVRYESYPNGNICRDEFEGKDLKEALINLCEGLHTYLDREEIEENEMSVDDILNNLEESNGDGCDYIFELKDDKGKLYIDI